MLGAGKDGGLSPSTVVEPGRGPCEGIPMPKLVQGR